MDRSLNAGRGWGGMGNEKGVGAGGVTPINGRRAAGNVLGMLKGEGGGVGFETVLTWNSVLAILKVGEKNALLCHFETPSIIIEKLWKLCKI